MADLPQDVIEKYDRQIRLFGTDVQKKILETDVVVLQGNALNNEECLNTYNSAHHSLVSGEIVKNFALLGFRKIYLNREALESFKRIVPNDIKDINENVKIEVIRENNLDDISDNQIVALVDQAGSIAGDNMYFICSGCYSFHPAFEAHNACVRQFNDESIAMECMIGSIFVHEMVKMLRGEEYLKNFKLEL